MIHVIPAMLILALWPLGVRSLEYSRGIRRSRNKEVGVADSASPSASTASASSLRTTVEHPSPPDQRKPIAAPDEARARRPPPASTLSGDGSRGDLRGGGGVMSMDNTYHSQEELSSQQRRNMRSAARLQLMQQELEPGSLDASIPADIDVAGAGLSGHRDSAGTLAAGSMLMDFSLPDESRSSPWFCSPRPGAWEEAAVPDARAYMPARTQTLVPAPCPAAPKLEVLPPGMSRYSPHAKETLVVRERDRVPMVEQYFNLRWEQKLQSHSRQLSEGSSRRSSSEEEPRERKRGFGDTTEAAVRSAIWGTEELQCAGDEWVRKPGFASDKSIHSKLGSVSANSFVKLEVQEENWGSNSSNKLALSVDGSFGSPAIEDGAPTSLP